ncbi:hypothetical protein NP233_g165 [Leucocoprinus birnbaumii]|uniref:pyranose dehydrogenase (acceptor) n=1 Tax=Leucocoprinus birnbaumii TaxID=56174 RepID=A0AAD5W2V5_9AGAR|nr:hypothetical protein NP233_g165 [Leucocoprinus birnbaumii]
MFSGPLAVLAVLHSATVTLGARYFRQAAGIPSFDHDFMIVGGGNAGGVVASRLGEVADYNALATEAGPSDKDVFDIQVLALAANIWFGSSVDWNFTTSPQVNAGNQILEYPRAKIRGEYGKLASPNVASLSEQGQYDPALHSKDGKLGVTAPFSDHPLNDLLLEATNQLSNEYPFLQDLNGGRPIGLGAHCRVGQAIIAHGSRSSSASAYLSHASDNVHVLLNTSVSRVVPTAESGGNDFRTIELRAGSDNATMKLTANKEVVVSAGVIQTPQRLLLSGIGPKDELDTLGITTFVDNPSVGKNFSDHVTISIKFLTDLPSTSFDETEALAQWKSNHTGRFALSQHMPQTGWVRFPEDSPPFRDGATDPTAGLNLPHVEVFFVGISEGQGGNMTLSVNIVDLTPVPRGSLTLATESPFDQPIIDPALLTSPLDTAILLEGFCDTPAPPSGGSIADEEVIRYIQNNANSFGHGAGTCSTAPFEVSWGVVDPDFRLRDVKGLRIVDASVLPFVASEHLQAPVYALAEWASDVIKCSHSS